MAVKLVKKDHTATPSQQGAASAAKEGQQRVRLVSTGKPVGAIRAPFSTEQTQTTATTEKKSAYDISGDAWTRATPSQTVIPSKRQTANNNLSDLYGLQEQRRQAQVDLDIDTMNRLDAQMKAIRAESGKQTLGDRASDIASAIFSGSAGAYTNAAGFASNAYHDPDRNRRQIAQAQEALSTGRLSDGKLVTPAMRDTILESIDRMSREIAEWEAEDSTTNRIYRVADRLGEESAKATESAKAGLGSVGGAVVDAAVSMGQSTLDALPAVLTGGAAGMIPFVVRSFGGATQEARQSGADMDTQLLYGFQEHHRQDAGEAIRSASLVQRP